MQYSLTCGHVTQQHLRSPILTFATKKLLTGANIQKEDAASFFVRAVLIELSCQRYIIQRFFLF